MRRENELISLFFRFSLDENKRYQIGELLKAHLDWDYIVREIETRGISSFVYRQLDRFKLMNYLPLHMSEHLKGCYYSTYSRNMALIKETTKILNAFAREGIEAMVLKGVFLTETIYKDIGLRSMGDIDILIKSKDVIRANRVLSTLAYATPVYYDDALKTHSDSLYSLLYRRAHRMNLFVHLHWHIVNSSWPFDWLIDKIDMDRIWESAIPVTVGGVDTLSLSPEHLLIYLAHHGLHHCFDKLILAVDIAEVVRHYHDRFDWDRVAQEAQRFGLSCIVYHALRYVSQVLPFEIPQLECIKPQKLGFLEKAISCCMHRGMNGYLLSYLAYLSREEGLFHRLRFITRTFFPSSYVMAHNYGLASSEVTLRLYWKRLIGKF